jgi:hypothetical protein
MTKRQVASGSIRSNIRVKGYRLIWIRVKYRFLYAILITRICQFHRLRLCPYFDYRQVFADVYIVCYHLTKRIELA